MWENRWEEKTTLFLPKYKNKKRDMWEKKRCSHLKKKKIRNRENKI